MRNLGVTKNLFIRKCGQLADNFITKTNFFRDYSGVPRIIPRRYLIAIISTCAVASLLIWVFSHPSLSKSSGFLALLILWLGLLPGLLFLNYPKNRQNALPILPLVGLFYAVFFGLSTFINHLLFWEQPVLKEGYSRTVVTVYAKFVDRTVNIEAQLIVILGLFTMLVTYYSAKKLLFRDFPRFRLLVRLDVNLFRVGIWVLLIAYFFYLYVPIIRLIPSVSQIIQPMGFLCFGGFYYTWKTGKQKKLETILVFFILFPMCWIKLVFTGLITPLLLYFIYFLVLEFWLDQKIPWLKVASALVIVGLIYPVMPTIRANIWSSGDSVSLIDQVKKKARSASDIFMMGDVNASFYEQIQRSRLQGLAQRISHISILTAVVDDTPQKVPFLSGESYKPLMTAVVPRLIWPDKPEERFGNTFGKRYGFLPEAEDGTNSVNCPWLTEMYANFGVIGVMVGMFIVGLMIAALEWFLCHWTMTPYEQIIGASILFPLFYQDSNFSLMVGSVPLTVITFWIFFKIVSLKALFRYW